MPSNDVVIDIPRIVSAVGNLETKAATFLAMPVNEALGGTAIKKTVEGLQIHDQVRSTEISVYRSYCDTSFIPANLMARATRDTGRFAGYRRLESPAADAVAGAMLDFSTLVKPSLQKIISSTHAPNKNKDDPEHVKRGPHNRLRILGILAAATNPLRNEDLSELADSGHRETSAHLKDLQKHAIVRYESHDTRKNDAVYILKQDNPEVSGVFREQFIALLAQHPNGTTRDALMAQLRQLRSDASTQSFKSMFYRASKLFEDQGVIERQGKAAKDSLSSASLIPEWREPIQELIGRLARIETGNEVEIAYWSRRGTEIVRTPEVLTPLIWKHFDQSQESQTRNMSQDKLRTQVLKAFAEKSTMEYAELSLILSGNHSLRSIRSVLSGLSKEGILSSVQNNKGTYIWTMPDSPV